MADLNLTSMGGDYSVAAIIAVLAALTIMAAIILLAIYVYSALAFMTIGKKLKYKYSWLAWIPIANISMILQMGQFSWAWVFLILIPFFGWIPLGVLCIISIWRIFEKRKYPGWLALIPLAVFVHGLSLIAGIGFLVVLGIVAWRRK